MGSCFSVRIKAESPPHNGVNSTPGRKEGNDLSSLSKINYLGQLDHPNLVKLIGYCLEDDQRLLVYEFMPRGSLDNHLFRRASYVQPLSWNHRMKIALGAAKGIAFGILHQKGVGILIEGIFGAVVGTTASV